MPPTVLAPSLHEHAKSPAAILANAEQQWLFTEDELLLSPSVQAGMTPDKEREVRSKGIAFIRQVGIMLKLPEMTLSTAAIFFNRFFMRVSLVAKPPQKAIHHYTLGATALFLATKVEENCRKMKDLVVACCRVAQKKPNLPVDDQSKDFWKWRDTILQTEDILLEMLCFDLTIEAPHRHLFTLLKTYRIEHHKQLRNAAWSFVTDSNNTQLCLLCSSRTIAVAAIYAAARMVKVQLPDDADGRAWWETQRVALKDMIKATNYMVKNYESSNEKNNAEDGDGSQSIYVGLYSDSDAQLSSSDEEGPWHQTRLPRLKSDSQGIPTPPRQLIGENERSQRGNSESGDGGRVKRPLEDNQGQSAVPNDARTGDSTKKRKVAENEHENGPRGLDREPQVHAALGNASDPPAGSEEGEVNE